ncbi:MAG: hypothetical protein ACK4NS_13570, partial [Saprospiraceae bacterium]
METSFEAAGKGHGAAAEAETAIWHWGFTRESARISPVGGGLLNDTFRLSSAGAEFYLQRINTKVFSNPQIIQRNIV